MSNETEPIQATSLGDRFASAVLGISLHPDQPTRLVYSVNQIARIFILRELQLPFQAEEQAMNLVASVIHEYGDEAPIFVTGVDYQPSVNPEAADQ